MAPSWRLRSATKFARTSRQPFSRLPGHTDPRNKAVPSAPLQPPSRQNLKKKTPANTWLGTSIRPGLPYNPSLRATDAGTGSGHGRDHVNQHHSSSLSSSPPPAPHPVLEEAPAAAAAPVTTSGDANEAPTTGGGNPSSAASGETGGKDSNAGLAAAAAANAPLAVVGQQVGQPLGGVPQRRAVSAAEAAALASAAVAAAGLARNWVGRRAYDHGGAARGSGGGGSGGGRAEGGGGGRGGGGGGAGEPRVSREEELRSLCVDVVASGEGTVGRRAPPPLSTAGEPVAPPAGAAGASAGAAPATSSSLVPDLAAAGVDRPVAAALRLAHKHQQQRRHPRHRKKSYRKPTRLRRRAGGPSAAPGGARGAAAGARASAAGGGASAPPSMAGAMTEEGLAAAERAMAAAAAAAAEVHPRLIRTVGRAKRGPCMFTLATSSSQKADGAKRAALPGKKDRRSRGRSTGCIVDKIEELERRRPVVWEAEATGGLLGPGEIKILVC